MLALVLDPVSAPHRHRHRHRHACLSSPPSSSSPVAASSLPFSSPSQWKAFTRTRARTRILKVKKIPLSFPSRADRASSSSSSSSRIIRPGRMDISCKVQTINQDTFSEDVLASDLPVLVGFCADWCGPCKLIGPILDTVSEQFDGSLKTLKIDTDASPDLVTEYDVYGLPTLILFKDGKEVPNSRREGTINAKKLKELLDELLATTTNS